MSNGNYSGKIKISKLVSTIILGTSFSTILLFGLIYYMYYDPKSEFTSALKESLSITASFFGGITTLVAAYIAAQLFNDWKEQQKHQNSLQFGLEVYSNFRVFDDFFKRIVEELLYLNVLLKDAVKDNDKNLIEEALNKTNEVSKKENELYFLYSNFHDSFLNYCIITKQEKLIENELYKTTEVFKKFNDSLQEINYTEKTNHRLDLLKYILSKPQVNLNTHIYLTHIRSILHKIRI